MVAIPKAIRATRSQAGHVALPEVEDAVDAVLRGARWLLFYGQVGTGKSTAALEVGEVLSAKHGDPHVLVGRTRRRPGLVWGQARELAAFAEWEYAKWEPFLRAACVVIDDMGTEPAEKRHRIESLLERRYYDPKAAIVATTNVPPRELFGAGGYDMRILDRFRELGKSVAFTKRIRPQFGR